MGCQCLIAWLTAGQPRIGNALEERDASSGTASMRTRLTGFRKISRALLTGTVQKFDARLTR